MVSIVTDEINDEDREVLEDSIMDASLSAERYLKSGKELHRKLLEVTVEDALAALSMYSKALENDPMKESYKLHMLVPVQIIEMINADDPQNK